MRYDEWILVEISKQVLFFVSFWIYSLVLIKIRGNFWLNIKTIAYPITFEGCCTMFLTLSEAMTAFTFIENIRWKFPTFGRTQCGWHCRDCCCCCYCCRHYYSHKHTHIHTHTLTPQYSTTNSHNTNTRQYFQLKLYFYYKYK